MEEFQHLDDALRCDGRILVQRVLELFGQVLDDEAWPLSFLQVQCLRVVAKLDSVDPNEVKLSSVIRSNRLDSSNVLLVLLIGRVDEEVCEWFRASRVYSIVLAIDFTDDRNGEFLDPLFDVFDRGRSDGIRIGGLRLIVTPVDYDCGRGDTSSRDGSLVGG